MEEGVDFPFVIWWKSAQLNTKAVVWFTLFMWTPKDVLHKRGGWSPGGVDGGFLVKLVLKTQT